MSEQKPEVATVAVEPVVGPVTATWSVSLDCECPACEKYVDLLTAPDFWDGKSNLQIPEHGTPRAKALEVQCPECAHEFVVRCDY